MGLVSNPGSICSLTLVFLCSLPPHPLCHRLRRPQALARTQVNGSFGSFFSPTSRSHNFPDVSRYEATGSCRPKTPNSTFLMIVTPAGWQSAVSYPWLESMCQRKEVNFCWEACFRSPSCAYGVSRQGEGSHRIIDPFSLSCMYR